jgi:hypothetical protein
MSKAVRLATIFALLSAVALAQTIRVWVTSVRLIESKKLTATDKRRIESQSLACLREQTKPPLDQEAFENALQQCDERARDALQQLGYFKAITQLEKYKTVASTGTQRVGSRLRSMKANAIRWGICDFPRAQSSAKRNYARCFR